MSAKGKEIPQDVDGHLYGGIPAKNLQDLTVLNQVFAEDFKEAFEEVRPGYLSLKAPIEEVEDTILNHSLVQEKQEQLSQEIKTYLASYWDELKNVDLESDFNVLRDSMLEDIKSLLGQQNFIDFYEGYEIMSNAWDQNIKSDLELIGDKGFYVAGRSVEPNYVTKGSGKKRFEVQQGSKGSLIPNDLIAEKLCQSEVETVNRRE